MQSVFRGGARVGASRFDAVNYTCPFARLEVSDRQCRIKIKCLMFSKDVLLKKDEIGKVELYTGFLSSGIKFTHGSMQAPPYIVFWSFSSRKIYDLLLSLGYQN